MTDKISILIADDHPVFLQGLRQIIQTREDFDILGEAPNGEKMLSLIREFQPRIAIMDISMPIMDGFAVVEALSKETLVTEVVFLTMFREESFFTRAMDIGVRGYVLKDSAAADIVSAIEAVYRGQHFISPELTSHLIHSKHATNTSKETPVSRSTELSKAEVRVLELIAQYKTSRQIADELCISPRTVDAHRTHICQKLGLHGRHALMKFALDFTPSSAHRPLQ